MYIHRYVEVCIYIGMWKHGIYIGMWKYGIYIGMWKYVYT